MFNRKGIPRFYSITVTEDGSCVVAMEKMKGLTLREFSKELIDEHYSYDNSYIAQIFI